MKKGPKELFTVKQVQEALEATGGISALAAQALTNRTGKSVTPRTIRNYLSRHPEMKEVIDEQVETALDLAESKMLTALNKGEKWAVVFYLETKGKGRGYTRRNEITGIGGGAIEVNDARERLIHELDQMGERLAAAPNGLLTGRAAGPKKSNGAATHPAKAVG